MKRVFAFEMLAMMVLLCASTAPGQKSRTRLTSSPQGSVTEASQDTAAAQRQAREPVTADERARVVSRLFANRRIAELIKGQRVSALSVRLAPNDKTGAASERRVLAVVTFNYSRGVATRYLVDAESSEILNEEILRGRPQSSPAEIQEATDLIRSDPQFGRLLQESAGIEGGFIVDGPRSATTRAAPNHRFIQLHILASDRARILRMVIVDLTDRKIAYSSGQ
jgi:hypothetical protein